MTKKKDNKVTEACEDNALELKEALLRNTLKESAELAEGQHLNPGHDFNEKSE